ncbi:hypothetical protein BURPS305_2135 [Burkholderia pseudomallei 305]|nr:hypothetical protein BURPS305_2135 [Burkholderia pseudomallei 305]EDU12747.1 hypothetical protein BURPS1655_D1688 [Burkholderia pseudomallei 1655]
MRRASPAARRRVSRDGRWRFYESRRRYSSLRSEFRWLNAWRHTRN